MKHYSFILEADQINLENPSENNGFEPLIKSKADIPLSTDQAKKMEIVAKIREIEAKTKEHEAKARQLDNGGNMGVDAGIDPMTGMPIDPMTGMPQQMGMGGIDPMTGMPMDQSQQSDPLQGLGDKSAPMSSIGGGVDPMTGMPTPDTGPVYTAIGRAYKLKDIFENLTKIKNYLRDTSNKDLEYLYKDVSKAFELYKLVINNLKVYKEMVDDLIIMYYELIKIILEKIKNTLNEKSKIEL